MIPDCIYTNPEIASVGLTEAQAKEQGMKVKTSKASMLANGKSMISLQDRGFIKLVYDEEGDRLVGAQLMCARATDMVGDVYKRQPTPPTKQRSARGCSRPYSNTRPICAS